MTSCHRLSIAAHYITKSFHAGVCDGELESPASIHRPNRMFTEAYGASSNSNLPPPGVELTDTVSVFISDA